MWKLFERKTRVGKAIHHIKKQHHKLDQETKFLHDKSDKLHFHDKFMNKAILWMFPKWILPNHVTVFRLVSTPLVMLLVYFENYKVGLVAFILIAFTDAIDGSMARTRHQITQWGRVYDPLADKILIGSMVFVIVLRYVDFWTSLLIVFMEVLIIFFAWMRKREGRVVQANLWGKIKMNMQVLGVAFLLISVSFDLAAFIPLASGALYLGIAFAVVSLLTHGI